MSTLIKPGEQAPDFELPKQFNENSNQQAVFKLSEKQGTNIILSFYPADWSPVCGSQNALYNELIPVFKSYDAEVIGISVDGVFCHDAYRNVNNFSMDLLADFEPKGKVARLYGAYNSDLGFCNRVIYVIDKNGIVRYSYQSPNEVNPGAKEILETLKKL